MLWGTLVPHPSTCSACAIGSALFTAAVRALVLLVLRYYGACPLPIMVNFGAYRSSHQRMNRRDTLHSCSELLRHNPAVPDELSCQLLTGRNTISVSWAARNCTFCESKVPKSQERIRLGDSQKKREHSHLPSLSGPRVLNRGQTMARVVGLVLLNPLVACRVG